MLEKIDIFFVLLLLFINFLVKIFLHTLDCFHFLKCKHSKSLQDQTGIEDILNHRSMNQFNVIITFILFGTVYTRQIGLIANHIFTYEPPTNNFSITTITFENRSSCNVCICAAFMSTIDYVAINCYKDNNTCSLLTSLINITDMISSHNSSLYILSYISMPLTTADNSTNSSSSTTTTSFITTTTNSIIATDTSVSTTADTATATTSYAVSLTGTTRTTTTTTIVTVITTTSRYTTASTTNGCVIGLGPICVL